VCIGLLLVAPAFAGDDCFEIAQNGPNVPHERGKCAMVGQSEAEAAKKPLDGLMQCKNEDGKVVEEARFKEGVFLSDWFYDLWNKKLSFTFSDDKAHGPAQAFAKDGKLLCEMNYVKGEADGAVREYYSDGKLDTLFWFKNGKLKQAPRVSYSSKGEVTHLTCPDQTMTPEDKDLCGFNGKPVTVKVHGGFEDTVTHFNGLLAKLVRVNRDEGRTWVTVYPEPGNKKTYTEEELFKNGKVFRSFSVIDDKKQGKLNEYADNGKLILEKEFKDNVDLWEKIFYMNGKLKEHSVRNSNDTSVAVKGYWDNGQLQKQGSFAFKKRGSFGNSWTDTVPVGKAYWYAEDGSLSEEATFDEEGNLDGARIQIDEKGKRTETVYLKGTLLAKKLFSSDGKLELAEEYYEDGSRK
jgi:antitoxin component YwqK of YwqJK toxin-antitoxin module